MARRRSQLITPEIGDTTGLTDPSAVAGGTRAAVQAGRAANQGIIDQFQFEKGQIARRANNEREAFGIITDLTKQVLTVREKSKAQTGVTEATLRIDEQIQALMHDPDVDNLELAERTQGIIDGELKALQTATRSASPEIKDYVTQKMGAIMTSKVPRARQEGWRREGQTQIAEMNRRNELRDNEYYAEGTPAERRAALKMEKIADLESLRGVHLNDEQVRAGLEKMEDDMLKNNLLAIADKDGVVAVELIESMALSPEEKLQLSNRVFNIMSTKENRRLQAEAQGRRELEKERSAADTWMTRQMFENGETVEAVINHPRVKHLVTGPMIRTMRGLEKSIAKAAENKDGVDISTMAMLRGQWAQGSLNPQRSAQVLQEVIAANPDMSQAQAKELFKGNSDAWKDNQSEIGTDWRRGETNGIKDIGRIMSFESSVLAVLDKSSQTQLNIAVVGANQRFRDEMKNALEWSRNSGRPFTELIGSPQQLANKTMIEFLPLAMDALSSQDINEEAYGAFFSETVEITKPDKGAKPKKLPFSQRLTTAVEHGRISMGQATLLRQSREIARTINRLKGQFEAPSQATQK